MDANAKINLFLRVTGLRSDGYHTLEMVNVSLDLHDDVDVRESSSPTIEIEGAPNMIRDVPANEKNLAWRAAVAACRILGKPMDYSIRIEKRIPAGAGLAGGSTDAAAVLRVLGDGKISNEAAAALGADVPYCMYRRPALVEGIGDLIRPIAMVRPLDLILVNPGFHVSTGEIFAEFDTLSGVDSSQAVARSAELMRVLESGAYDQLPLLLFNDLERVACRRFPEIDEIKKEMIASGAVAARMSGSGPTVFGIFADESLAKRAEEYWSRKEVWSCRVRSII